MTQTLRAAIEAAYDADATYSAALKVAGVTRWAPCSHPAVMEAQRAKHAADRAMHEAFCRARGETASAVTP